jgi:hypothetical protein
MNQGRKRVKWRRKQVLGRTSHILPFYTTWAAYKTTPTTIFRCRGNVFTEPLPSNDRGIQTQILLSYDTDRIESDACNDYSIIAYILCHRNVFTEPLSRNDTRGIQIQTHRLMREIYEVRRWDGFSCHDIHTKFRKDWFRHPKLKSGRDSQTHRQHGDCISLL